LLMPNEVEVEIAAIYNEEVQVVVSGDNMRIRLRGSRMTTLAQATRPWASIGMAFLWPEEVKLGVRALRRVAPQARMYNELSAILNVLSHDKQPGPFGIL
jgi:hypothetical protein